MNKKSAAARNTTARALALDVLTEVEVELAYSNLLLNQRLSNSRLSPADKGLATELVYGTIQRLNTLDYMLNRFVKKGVDSLQPWVRNLLRLSFYQLAYLDRIPVHAVVHEAVNLAKRRGHAGISGMVNGVLRNALRSQDGLLQAASDAPPARRIAIRHSHPEWLVERWLRQFGEEETEAICEANNRPPKVSIRVNRLRRTREELLEMLREAKVDCEPSALSPDGIVVKGAGNMAHTSWYEGGECSIQDESSMLVARAVCPEPGMKVLDACAAPGGKTTHLAELMEDKGELWANDIHAHKEQLVRSQAERLSLQCVKPMVEDALKLPEHFAAETFDRILLDAPCSGLGVIRRKPDLKWRKDAREIESLASLQLELLQALAPLVKPGGRLVYSTCTIERSENEQVCEAFLNGNASFEPDHSLGSRLGPALANDSSSAAVQILPHHFGSDGFYIASFTRKC
ncbi:16S rRNA (cytosine(967)-C(5))-methyltransferase RsmB [Xylanibacillus composti]|uniref:16S rRNA (cytosine(967)-C(5))-methyltransferase n=1 Tax=Xylanibacillus composti TaxID=1572762 RepID=A0A8J4H167_9BACL|nr:16S rRNA (cytosine(967)-C(5))-methyltransferase RsmB [Xylanibacillus composti]MDT9725597.1 16S rRNA (cytosine(967)-C(5))-methyltransferase RsmB [Xylanibacillus composti]GIQ67690.1 ribosomal RNA small subunit methyltransferase B [Xylanibacillus composti]